MTYTPTGKPVGRPKTKDYKTISLKMPQDLLDRVQTYARLHRQTISELIRDGLDWRITDGDPRSVGVPHSQRTLREDGEYSGNSGIPHEVPSGAESVGMLQEIRTALARQETQLSALTQALEQRTITHPRSENSGNANDGPGARVDTQEPGSEGEYSGNTAFPEPFDPERFYLGKLCPQGHDYQGTGQSLLRKSKGDCRRCMSRSVRRARKREAVGLR